MRAVTADTAGEHQGNLCTVRLSTSVDPSTDRAAANALGRVHDGPSAWEYLEMVS